jgi:hypothetical protein
MPLSNRELLMQQRKKAKGLPVATNKVATTPISKRGTGAVGKGLTGKSGFQGKARRAGKATLEEFPGVAEGIVEPGDALAEEYKGLRPQVKDPTKAILGGDDEATGMPSNVTLAKTTAPGTRTAIDRDRAAKGLAPTGGTSQAPIAQFGLPTDRLPSFSELGGAIGGLFKYIGQLSKFNRARGLVPGTVGADKNKGKGLGQKDRADIFIKQLESAQLAGDKDKVVAIQAELDKIIHPDRESDVQSILNQ